MAAVTLSGESTSRYFLRSKTKDKRAENNASEKSSPVASFYQRDAIQIKHSADLFHVNTERPWTIARIFRNVLMTPLNRLGFFKHEVGQIERNYLRFWRSDETYSVYYGDCNKVRRNFDVYDQKLEVSQVDGTKVIISLRIYESKVSKDEQRPYANLAVYGGNLATINQMATFSEGLVHDPSDFPLRIISLSCYDIHVEGSPHQEGKYDAPTLKDLSMTMALALKGLHESYGKIDGLVCHSLSTIMLHEACAHLKEEHLDFVPKLIVLDRGCSSVNAAAKKYTFTRKPLLFFAKAFGWVNSHESGINALISRASIDALRGRVVMVSHARNDYFFLDEAGLNDSHRKEISKRGVEVHFDQFSPPRDMTHERSDHARSRHVLAEDFGSSYSHKVLGKLKEIFLQRVAVV